ncbi:hypothetical protein FisN_7Lh163 [Fistulifera solaris]|uniref:Plastid lipid-associated protein/fibrillin conserved domain-containing protein n=1 Tax=Fistulifera solaris TaxID=1519565 RepID=A0A1Z5JDE2_FISSO|nr:hypothetical protein FisN_7Lh163 [Fistulifera solaris]|eukprot:GAX11781.1 hypothetical protein FisN_7Lh163 [Fistulifera solaris]
MLRSAVYLVAVYIFHALSLASAFVVRHCSSARFSQQGLQVTTSTKDGLFELLQQAPKNTPTSQKLTADILTTVRLLEKECPTPDAEILQALAGPWELIWTAQDPNAPESNRLLLSWINPLENQSYSIKPYREGRSNPVLPRTLEDKLEEAGLTTSVGNFRSTQTIDMKSKQVINVVTVDINVFGKRQRATVTVLVDFVPNRRNARQIDVKMAENGLH